MSSKTNITMFNLNSSIVKGFGFTLGRTAANALVSSTQTQKVSKSNEIECFSHLGYQEGDVEISYEYDYYKKQIKWYAWVIFLFPIVNLFKSIPYFYNVFIKKNKVYFYDMKWVTFQVSDARMKSGIREIKKLQPELGRVDINPPLTRHKVEAVVALSISLFLNLPIIIGAFM